MRLAFSAQTEAAAGHFFKARGQVELGLAVDLVGEVVRAEALDGGQGSKALDLGKKRGRGRRRSGRPRPGAGP